MASLSENDILSRYTGRPVCMDHLLKCAQYNGPDAPGKEYIVYSCGFLYKPELRELFGITDQLKERWEQSGTEFNVHVYEKDGVITACHIRKYKEGSSARPSYRSLKCTQQDLKIADQILRFITE